MEQISVFAPATVANVSCGFDVLGFALDTTGDYMHVKKSAEPGVRITKIDGAPHLPLETKKNVAGVAAESLLQALGKTDLGFDIHIEKRIKPGSGIGSSAASSAGAVFAINALLGNPLSTKELIPHAMEGESLASGTAHADNVAPALLGGFSLIRSYDPLDVIALGTPDALFCTVIHPLIEVKTQHARSILTNSVSLENATRQWGNVGALVAGLLQSDYNLVGRALEDVVIEPIRSILIPGFDKVKEAAITSGALGAGISGSGPSVFSLSQGEENALRVKHAMEAAYTPLNIDFEIHVSKINAQGVKII